MIGSGTGVGDWINYRRLARVVKLVDTRDLKSRRFRAVPVRPRPRAPFTCIQLTNADQYVAQYEQVPQEIYRNKNQQPMIKMLRTYYHE